MVTQTRTGDCVRHNADRGDLERARERLSACDLCAFACGVDRGRGETGRCAAGPRPTVFSVDLLFGEELCLCPSFGIRLAGCNLRCPYCDVWPYSQDPQGGESLDVADIARRARLAAGRGAVNAHVMGGEPTIHLPSVLELAVALPPELPLVLNTNLYWSPFTRDILCRWVDIWVLDMRVGCPDCCTALGAPADYVEVAGRNLAALPDDARVLLRHLALPGHIDCCAAGVIRWAEEYAPQAILSPWLEYFPPEPSQAPPGLCRPLSSGERSRLRGLVSASGLRVEGSW